MIIRDLRRHPELINYNDRVDLIFMNIPEIPASRRRTESNSSEFSQKLSEIGSGESSFKDSYF